MRFSSGIAALGVTAVVFSFPVDAQDKGRVIEETLVVKDPTVAERGKWLLGAAFEELFTYGPYKAHIGEGDAVETGTIHAFKPGFNAFAGYGDFSMNFVYRKGTETIPTHHNPNGYNSADYDHTRRYKTIERELSMRWRLRDWDTDWYAPYFYLSYQHLNSDVTNTITTPGVVFGNGSDVEQAKATTKTWYGGLGAIFPSNDHRGYRLDAALNYTYAKYDAETYSVEGHGIGGRLTGTMYYLLSEGTNLQGGGRCEWIKAPPAFWRYRCGVFLMLGYTFRN
jgi:hypothetical protein